MDRKPIIAVDGVSGSGKSTIARTLARKYGLTYIDTGAMYRALTYYAMQKHYLQEGEFFKNLLIADLNKIEIGFDAQGHTLLNGQDVESEIRSMEVSQNVSLVSSVRKCGGPWYCSSVAFPATTALRWTDGTSARSFFPMRT